MLQYTTLIALPTHKTVQSLAGRILFMSQVRLRPLSFERNNIIVIKSWSSHNDNVINYILNSAIVRLRCECVPIYYLICPPCDDTTSARAPPPAPRRQTAKREQTRFFQELFAHTRPLSYWVNLKIVSLPVNVCFSIIYQLWLGFFPISVGIVIFPCILGIVFK